MMTREQIIQRNPQVILHLIIWADDVSHAVCLISTYVVHKSSRAVGIEMILLCMNVAS